jgi:hypothetical protein
MLTEMIEFKGLNFLRNIKTRWISMLAPFKRMLREYKTLVVKMNDDVVMQLLILTMNSYVMWKQLWD